LSDGSEEVAEYTGAGALLRRYIPGPGTDQPIAMVTPAGGSHTRSYFHVNRQGSTVAMSNDAGVMAEGPYTYDAYGQGPTSAGVPFKYTGRRLDPETGLYYYRARYYSASLGRFLQTDPVGYADQMNLYGYVNNDPGNATDPSGKTSYYVQDQVQVCFIYWCARVEVTVGYDDDEGFFMGATGGTSSQSDPDTEGGFGGGVGFSVGGAESLDFLASDAYVLDVDAGPFSIAGASNTPLCAPGANNCNLTSSKKSPDKEIRAFSIGIGAGGGVQQIKTTPIVTCSQKRGCDWGQRPAGPKKSEPSKPTTSGKKASSTTRKPSSQPKGCNSRQGRPCR
jgi:RHS repeat-associated protein